jgi:methanogenic corrinoid protein MtbC1
MEPRKSPSSEPRLTIGAVARATGLSADTIRVWQKRYGFPVPHRRPSGHRVYSLADVRRLRRISEALARGHRPGQVVVLSEARLDALLTGTASMRSAPPQGATPLRPLMRLVRAHDGQALTSALLSDAAALGPIEFLQLRIVPLIELVGDGWERGELGIAHEHSFSERVEDVLRVVRLPYERDAAGPRITLATLSGETHGLGLQMCAVVAAVSGLAPHLLGTDLPVSEIAAASRARKSAALGISISISTGGPSSRDQLAELRRAVPAATPILVGGLGARRSHPPGGCVIVEDLQSLHAWTRRLSA